MTRHSEKMEQMIKFLKQQNIPDVTLNVLLIKICAAVILVLIQILIARILGPDQYGQFILITFWCMLLSVFGKLGFDVTYLRFMPIYRQEGNIGAIRSLIRFSVGVCFLTSVALFLILFIPALKESIIVNIFALITLLGLVVMRFLDSYLKSLDIIVSSHFLQEMLRPILFLGLFLMSVFFFQSSGYVAATIAYTAAIVLVCILMFVQRSRSKSVFPAEEKGLEHHTKGEWIAHALPVMMIAGTAIIINRIDIVMIGYFQDQKSVAIYSVAHRISEFTIFGLFAATSLLSPYISKLHAKGDLKELQAKIDDIMRPVGVLTILAAFGILALGSFVLQLFGPVYTTGMTCLFILVCSQTFNGLCGPVSLILSVTGYQKMAFKISILAAVLNVIANALLIPAYGIEGAAIASALSYVLWNVLMLVFIRRKLGLISHARWL